MKNFEFKSQVVTSIEQSKRLLELGIKKETADCRHWAYIKNSKGNPIPKRNQKWVTRIGTDESAQVCGFMAATFIPAWSLHRLMEIIQNNEKQISYILDREELTIEWFDDGGWKNKFFRRIENTYDRMISCIEYMLKEGLINPDYLEEKK